MVNEEFVSRRTCVCVEAVDKNMVGVDARAIVVAGGGTADHDKLKNRDMVDQHPIAAITGLEIALDEKLDDDDVQAMTNMEIEEILNGFV